MAHFVNRNHNLSFEMNSKKYLKARPPDCCIYSEDGSQFKIHRELLCQNDFLRKILESAKDCCCSAIEIFCPCSDKELVLLVKFLYTGEIVCDDIDDLTKTIDNLKEIFGFPNELPLWPQDRDIPNDTSNHNVANFIVKEQSSDQPEIICYDENDNNSNLQEPDIDLPNKYSTCCNEKDPLGDAFTTTELPEDQNLENKTSSNLDIPAFSVKERPLEQVKDISTDQGENEISFDSHESENDFQVEHSKCYNENDTATTEGIDFEHGADEKETIAQTDAKKNFQTDAKKNSKARNIEKKFKCDKCDASFLGKQALTYHCDKVHHICNYCKKVFKEKSTMLKHINGVHLKIQPYVCNECEKAFSKKPNLQRHVKLIHLKLQPPKPYICNECEKAFPEKGKFQRHVDSVHLKIKPFKCQYCEHGFGDKRTLQKHILRFHQSLVCRREDETKK